MILSSLQRQPRDLLRRAGFEPVAGQLAFSADLREATTLAQAALAEMPQTSKILARPV